MTYIGEWCVTCRKYTLHSLGTTALLEYWTRCKVCTRSTVYGENSRR